MLRLINDIGLIGDALGTIPVMLAIATIEGPGNLWVTYHPEAQQIMEMVPKKYGIIFECRQITDLGMPEKTLDLSSAFRLASIMNYHMTQAHFPFVGLPVPDHPIQAELEYPGVETPEYDFIIAPFSRSLPPEQKWTPNKWKALVGMFPDKKFAVFGNPIYDDPNYLIAPNVTNEYGRPLVEVLNIMNRARYGVISVVTGISHFAYHVGVRNILLVNQGAWGKNPNAICITDPIPQLTPTRVAVEMHKAILGSK